MGPRWANLAEKEQRAFHTVVAFLNGRLEDWETVDWALRLEPNDTVKRLALLHLIDTPDGLKIGEPWRSAWRLIEESWNNSEVEDHALTDVYDVQHRLHAGDRSGSLVNAIVKLVAPRLRVTAFSRMSQRFRESPKRPKSFAELFSAGLASGEIIDPTVLGLGRLNDGPFLISLALALDAAVDNGLDIARRVGWDGKCHQWPLGDLCRVYYVSVTERADGTREPDDLHEGIAPSVKLLHAVVSQLVEIDNSAATEFVRRWKLANSPIQLRLWAALSRDSRITPANEVAALLSLLNDLQFWNLGEYPEIAELRAKRFGELEPHAQATLTARIRKLPPRNQWPKKVAADRVKNYRLYWAVRELRRIEIAGAALPQRDKTWLDTSIGEFPDLVQMARLDEGFIDTAMTRFAPPNSDSQYDLLTGEERLKALEAAFSTARGGWDDDPAGRATDWIRLPGNSVQVLADLESIPDGGVAFARVWGRLGWAHSPKAEQGENTAQRDLPGECALMLSLLAKLPEATVLQAIDGISHWLSAWEKQVVVLPEGISVWLKLWPSAVKATNAKQPVEEEALLNTVAQSSNDREPTDDDTVNTPAGKLVGVFLAACPKVLPGEQPFPEGSSQRSMRSAIEAALGPTGSIVKYRLIEQMPYFLATDKPWTLANLVEPLRADSAEAQRLWRAVARQKLSFEVMAVLGNAMADHAIDPHLGRNTRRSLVFRIVVECLHAFKDQRDPAVPRARITQMLRSLDDEVRAFAAEAVQRFVREVSVPREGERPIPSPEQLFRSAAAPFLQQAWPQERSLATAGVSLALADLPVTAREAFAEAVDAIERFLVPFKCWSMVVYSLYGEENGKPKLSSIDNQTKAAALLRLLDLTIGTAEGAVIPNDLADALDQIRNIAPNLTEKKEFRRLATAARRV